MIVKPMKCIVCGRGVSLAMPYEAFNKTGNGYICADCVLEKLRDRFKGC